MLSFRINRFKALCMILLTLGVTVYLVIVTCWGSNPYSWEFLYTFPAGLGLGVVQACTFTWLTMSTPLILHATVVCIYYLCQQVGRIIETNVSSVAIHTIFRNTLGHRLKGIVNKKEVCDLSTFLSNFGYESE